MVNGKRAILIFGGLSPEVIHLSDLLRDRGYVVITGEPELYSSKTYSNQNKINSYYYNNFEGIVYFDDANEFPDITGYYGNIFGNPITMRVCNNKATFYDFCVTSNIPTINSWTINQIQDIEKLPYPIVCKTVNSRDGIGVIKVNSESDLRNLIKQNSSLIMQNCISSTYGKCYRVLYSHKTLIGTVLIENENNFKSNGGKVSKVETLPDEIYSYCEKIVNCLNLDFVNIDLLRDGDNNFYVCDVNTDHGFESFVNGIGIDPFESYADYIDRSIVARVSREDDYASEEN